MIEMGADAACMHELRPVEAGETSDATLGEIATEFVMETADAERMDVGAEEEEGEEGEGGEEGDSD